MSKFFYILNIISEKLGKIFLLLSILATCYFSMKTFSAGNPASSLFYLLCCTLPLALFSGILFVRIYLPGIAERIAYGFFGGRSYLSMAPLILSPLWGDLKNGRCRETMEKAEVLLEKHPFHGELLYIYCSAALQLPEGKEKALFQLEKYFFMDGPNDVWHIKLLFLYMDNAPLLRPEEEIANFLQTELARRNYTKTEKEAVSLRLKTFQKGSHNNE